MSEIHIIFTEDEVLISTEPYASWREIQGEYDGYKASLGPWDAATVSSWLDEEYSDLIPSAEEQVLALVSGSRATQSVSFKRHS